MVDRAATLGELKATGWQSVPVKEEIRANAVVRIAAGQPLFQKFGRRAGVSQWHPTQSNYHSLQTKYDRRLAQGFLLTTAYTYSKAIDVNFFQQLKQLFVFTYQIG